MHLWVFKRAGKQLWDFLMLKMSETGILSESYPIPSLITRKLVASSEGDSP